MSYKERYTYWIEKLAADDPMRKELLDIADDEAEIKERFYKEIEFGTAGLRGVRGAGTNRMNVLTVGRATQGIANYILSSGENKARGMVLAYDCRYFPKSLQSWRRRSSRATGSRCICFPPIARHRSCLSRSEALMRSAGSI